MSIETETFEDATLLFWKMEEGVLGPVLQEMQLWKLQKAKKQTLPVPTEGV